MVEPGKSAVSVDHVENLICLGALQEDDTYPSSNRLWIGVRSFMPSNATSSTCCGIESFLCLVDEGRRLVEFVSCRESLLRTDGVVTVVIKRTRPILDLSGSELIEHLLERSHTREQITEHPIQILWIFERTSRVREPAQRLGCFPGVSAGIVERGHGDLLGIAAAIANQVSGSTRGNVGGVGYS